MDLGSVNIKFKGDTAAFTSGVSKVNDGLAKTAAVSKKAAVDTQKLTLNIEKMRIEHGQLAAKIAASGDKTGLLANKMKTLEHNISLAQAKIRSANQALSTTADVETKVAKNTDTLGTKLGGLKTKALAAGLAFGAAGLAAALGGALRAGIKHNSAIEQTTVSLKVMLGSQKKANDLIAEMTKFAAKTPYEFPELAEATKKLLAFGVAQEDIIPTMTKLGDISAGLGIQVGELAELYGKAKVQGRLFAEDVNQLTGRGIPVIQEFAKQFGVAESAVRGLVEKGMIGFPELEVAITNLTKQGGKFGGLMEAQSKTLAGQWSTLKDGFNALAGDMAKPIFSYLVDKVLPKANELLGKISGLAKKGDWGGVFKMLIKSLGDVIGSINWGKLTKAVGAAIEGAVSLIGPLVIDVIPQIVVNIPSLIYGIGKALAGIPVDLARAIAKATGSEEFFGFLPKVADQVHENAADIAKSFDDMRQAEAKAASASAFRDILTKMAGGAGAAAEKLAAMAVQVQSLQGLTEAIAVAGQKINLGSIWDNAKGSLASYRAAVGEELAKFRVTAAKMANLQEWFPKIPPSAWAEVASMPGFAEALVAEGRDAASKDVWAMIQVMAAGGDPAAQAYIDSFGQPKLKPAIASVTPSGYQASRTFAANWVTPQLSATVWTHYANAMGFAKGGPIPGAGPVPIVAHGGEYMLNKTDMSELGKTLTAALTGKGDSGGGSSAEVLAAIQELIAVTTAMPKKITAAVRAA